MGILTFCRRDSTAFILTRFPVCLYFFDWSENQFSQEFLTGMKIKVKEPEGMKMLKEAFKVFDSNGNGSVSRLEKLFNEQ